MPHREPNYISCCQLVKGNMTATNKFEKLRAYCGLDIRKAAKMFSLDLGEYLQLQRGEVGFRDWQRCMEIMCILSNKPFDLIDAV